MGFSQVEGHLFAELCKRTEESAPPISQGRANPTVRAETLLDGSTPKKREEPGEDGDTMVMPTEGNAACKTAAAVKADSRSSNKDIYKELQAGNSRLLKASEKGKRKASTSQATCRGRRFMVASNDEENQGDLNGVIAFGRHRNSHERSLDVEIIDIKRAKFSEEQHTPGVRKSQRLASIKKEWEDEEAFDEVSGTPVRTKSLDVMQVGTGNKGKKSEQILMSGKAGKNDAALKTQAASNLNPVPTKFWGANRLAVVRPTDESQDVDMDNEEEDEEFYSEDDEPPEFQSASKRRRNRSTPWDPQRYSRVVTIKDVPTWKPVVGLLDGDGGFAGYGTVCVEPGGNLSIGGQCPQLWEVDVNVHIIFKPAFKVTLPKTPFDGPELCLGQLHLPERLCWPLKPLVQLSTLEHETRVQGTEWIGELSRKAIGVLSAVALGHKRLTPPAEKSIGLFCMKERLFIEEPLPAGEECLVVFAKEAIAKGFINISPEGCLEGRFTSATIKKFR